MHETSLELIPGYVIDLLQMREAFKIITEKTATVTQIGP
jgi:hypothetical protein